MPNLYAENTPVVSATGALASSSHTGAGTRAEKGGVRRLRGLLHYHEQQMLPGGGGGGALSRA